MHQLLLHELHFDLLNFNAKDLVNNPSIPNIVELHDATCMYVTQCLVAVYYIVFNCKLTSSMMCIA